MPVQPNFAGDGALFGAAAIVVVAPNPARVQLDAYPGVNGRTALAMGVDGGRTVADVVYWFPALDDLTLRESATIALAAQGPRNTGVLTDAQGRLWPGVYLAAAQPREGVVFDGFAYSRRWRLIFEHLM